MKPIYCFLSLTLIFAANATSYEEEEDGEFFLADAQAQKESGYLQAQSNGSSPQKKKAAPPPIQAINLPARPVVEQGWNLWIVGEGLLWQAVQENMEYVYKGSDDNSSQVRDLKKPHFDWNGGWRFGAGYNIPHDRWDLFLLWTHIENHAHGSTSAEEETLYNVWTVADHVDDVGIISKASAHWEAHLDQVDLNLGRQFYVGRYLTVRPNAGMRSAWIFQDYDPKLRGSNGHQKCHMTNRYWGLGFFAGLDNNWILTRCLSLYSDVGFAVLLGFFDVDQRGTFNGSTISKLSESFRTGRPIFDIDLGLKWASNLYNDRFAIALKVGYEYHLYCNQNQYLLSSGESDFELFNPVNGDLTYQGVTFSAQFDF